MSINQKKPLLKRSIVDPIRDDLDEKIVILSGPRQCGKTTLSKQIFSNYEYLNYDSNIDRKKIINQLWNRQIEILILDEIHKMKKWKSWLKGIYDTEGLSPKIIVTGSAKLEAFHKTGDSLAGRHFHIRLHPFDIKESLSSKVGLKPEEALERLLKVGGFPEPFLNGSINYYNRWKRTHIDLILKTDLLEMKNITDIKSIEFLIHLLSERVGTSVSFATLASALDRDIKTVQKWVEVLENLYVLFRLTPHHENMERSLKKEPKFYFYDTAMVLGDESAKLENVVACALLKEMHYLQDIKGEIVYLHYLKIRGGKEVDFFFQVKGHHPYLIEVKLSETDISPNLALFGKHYKNPKLVQVVKNLKRRFSNSQKIDVEIAAPWLANLNFLNTP